MIKTVIITGGAGIIGQATAKTLKHKGYQVVLADLSFREQQDDFTYQQCDVTQDSAVGQLFGRYADTLCGIVLAAGIEGAVASIDDISEEQFDRVMDVNVKGIWLGLKHAIRIFKPRGQGNIIALASTSGMLGVPRMAAYSASKHAVMGLVKSAAREVARFGVRVNSVCPGPVESAMMKRIDGTLLAQDPNRFYGNSDASGAIPMKRYATPEEVAHAIVYLCSDDSSFTTGNHITLDGGLMCR
ncbi:MAG: SDR family oxidoreductase [Candidatus Paracaedibacteraceae bacterium]|nr:SDR family oxidoreductase [Candidatus Paracaedibacteraceae bacterium]